MQNPGYTASGDARGAHAPQMRHRGSRRSRQDHHDRFYGASIICIDEPNVQAIIPSVKRPIITYGTSSQADLVISDIKLGGLGSEFRLTYKGEDLGLFRLAHPPGIHNV